MAVKLFVLGLPGSGKSTVSRGIAEYVSENWGWKTTHINDYAILQQMYHDDSQRIQFKPADCGGFDVLDLTVFDIALKRLEQTTKQQVLSAKPEEMFLIEFSRNDYQRAFQQFSHPSFLKDAYFLYLDVSIETCKRRIRERITHPTTPDDHFVSEFIFSTYYNKDNGQDIPYILEKDYGIDKQRVTIIDDMGSLQEASPEIHSFIDLLLPVRLPV